MKYFIILIVFFTFVSSCYGFQSINIDSPNTKIAQQQKNNIADIEDISSMEKYVFKKTFPSESVIQRVVRLEKEIYGMEQKGTIQDRIDNLLKIYEYYKDNYNMSNLNEKSKNTYYSYNVREENNYDSKKHPKQTRWQKFLNDIVESFSYGTTTGYTPPIYNTYSSYPRYLGNNYLRQPYNINNYYNPYLNNYRRHYNPPMPPPPPMNHNNQYFYNNPMKNFQTGIGVKIVD